MTFVDDLAAMTDEQWEYLGIDRRMYPMNAREITMHHDGHGLNESIAIRSDEPDHEKGGGAAHRYEFTMGPGTETTTPTVVGFLQFQHGPRKDPASTPGVTEAAVLAILIDRLRGFQAGPFKCRENAIIITKLEECLLWTKARADERAGRGVLGKNEK
jgi:hypothetical protein